MDGYMEDLAADRIYRLMISQSTIHSDKVELDDGMGNRVAQTPELVTWLFDNQLERILNGPPFGAEQGEIEKYRQARRIGEEMIVCHQFSPA